MTKGKFHLEEGMIIYLYRQAEDKKEQIKILAQLNACSKDDIIDFLEDKGINVSDDIRRNKRRYSNIRPKKDPNIRERRTAKHKHYTEDELEELKRLHALGMNDVEISYELNRSTASIRKWRIKMGLPANAPNHWCTKKKEEAS